MQGWSGNIRDDIVKVMALSTRDDGKNSVERVSGGTFTKVVGALKGKRSRQDRR